MANYIMDKYEQAPLICRSHFRDKIISLKSLQEMLVIIGIPESEVAEIIERESQKYS